MCNLIPNHTISMTIYLQILCIQLQRASVNKFGESVKLQGHISFPMILDLFPFTKDAVGLGLENLNENLGKIQVKQHLSPIPRHNYSDMQLEWQMLKHTDGPTEDYVISDYGGSLHRTLHDKRAQAFQAQSGVFQSEGLSHPEITKPPMRSDIKMETREIHPLVPSKNSMYQLVSVVEHFGRAGTGHYTVYRRVKEESNGEDSVRQGKPAQWLCASDSKVFSVSERDVFTAEASMLFYERIEVSKQVPSLL
ncbi:hypothetical protein IFM89_038660 [Coptis chinensis]|uniref:ubiquitinyl hydrolase 1 n=1 Tax=Coptis chinensis TaxID=261450 RepID=A0A835IAD3_9MAGN|nr:hypothetical protein IFM89_038660 [Coptis chinensis]